MGHLGWTPYEYKISSPREFHAASEGYFDERKITRDWIRFAAFAIASAPYGLKPGTTLDMFWKTENSKLTVEIPDAAYRERIMNNWKKRRKVKPTES